MSNSHANQEHGISLFTLSYVHQWSFLSIYNSRISCIRFNTEAILCQLAGKLNVFLRRNIENRLRENCLLID